MFEYDFVVVEVVDGEIIKSEAFDTVEEAEKTMFHLINCHMNTSKRKSWPEVEQFSKHHYRFEDDCGYGLVFDWIIEKVPVGTSVDIRNESHVLMTEDYLESEFGSF